MKKLLLIIVCTFLGQHLFAQQHHLTDKDTLLYYINNNNQLVKTKPEADFFLIIMPADSSSGVKVYPVIEYYPTMKKKLLGYSRSQLYFKLVFEGECAEFYPNGNKKSLKNYSNGNISGIMTLYYPNGKLYADEAYDKDGNTYLINCQDSTGNVLASNGNGKWIEYDDYYREFSHGAVKDSLKEGEWIETMYGKNDTTVFKKGEVISSTSKYRQLGKESDVIFAAVEHEPRFIGDFGAYLAKTVNYPEYAKEHHKQGRVVVQFVVERDGSLTGLRLAKSSGSVDLDNEAIRVLKISPKWQPGIQNNKPVRVFYTVPISFTLSGGE
jgi:TonB family protein